MDLGVGEFRPTAESSLVNHGSCGQKPNNYVWTLGVYLGFPFVVLVNCFVYKKVLEPSSQETPSLWPVPAMWSNACF